MKKIQEMKTHEDNELEIQQTMQNNTIENFKYRNYNAEALKLLKPTLSINKLVN